MTRAASPRSCARASALQSKRGCCGLQSRSNPKIPASREDFLQNAVDLAWEDELEIRLPC